MDFFGVGETQFGEVFWYNKNETHGSLKILTTHTVFHTYLPMRFFGDFSSLAESEGKEHLPQNPPLELEKSTGGETMSLDDKNFMLCLFQ